jgi:ribosome biogenesis GTPase / thiamine phosphate phosphatase
VQLSGKEQQSPAGSVRGLVTGLGSRSLVVHVPGRGEVRCSLRGTLWVGESEETRPVAVGDEVLLTLGDGEGVVESLLPRRNRLARPDAGKAGRADRKGKSARLQVIAANIDRLIVVASLADPPFRPGLADRFLVAAMAQELTPVLVLNKVDLAEPDALALAAPYEGFGLTVLKTSCRTGEGIAELAELMRDVVSLLVGHSGVGKTSLLNAVSPGLALHTGAVSDYHGRGRHTTTKTSLLPLAGGGFVVDSPGIREFGVTGLTEGELARLYPGFGELPDACRFADCLHRNEPGCAVRAAVASGALSAERHEAYLRLLEGLP